MAEKAGLQTVATDYDLVELRTGDGASVSSDSVDQAATAKDQILNGVDAAADSSPDATLQSGIAPLINDQDLSDEQAAALNWLLGVEIPLDLGAGPNEVSVEGFSEGSNLGGGPDLMIRGGAFQLVEAIAAETRCPNRNNFAQAVGSRALPICAHEMSSDASHTAPEP